MNKPASARERRIACSSVTLTLSVVAFILIFGNSSFWRATTDILSRKSLGDFFILSGTGAILFAAVAAAILIVSMPVPGRFIKPVLFVFLVISGVSGYFMDAYGIVIDSAMLQNVRLTDSREASELMTWSFFAYFFMHSLLPCVLIAFVKVKNRSFVRELLAKVIALLGSFLLVLIVGLLGYKEFAFLGREHRDLRLFMNPVYPIYSVFDYARDTLAERRNEPLRIIAPDASRTAFREKTVVVLVLGETARSKQFHINGYPRNTTPRLETLDVLSFPNVRSCATATAQALPCIFSHLARDDFSRGRAMRFENVLDILDRSGVSVLWRDNNSGSQGLAARVAFEDLSQEEDPRYCGPDGCFDEILLDGLDDKMAAMEGDGLIVLHQKGSHGPSYYKRTPPEFKTFLPECDIDSVQNCASQDIVNAYDNTIVYTDHVLAELIGMLDRQPFATAMLYVSDHGESLGENNIYLHGLPYFLAPTEQTHIPLILWISDRFRALEHIDTELLYSKRDSELRHDHIFHSLLGLFGVQSSVRDPSLDIFSRDRQLQQKTIAR